MPAKDTFTVASRISKENYDQISLIVSGSGTSQSKVLARVIDRGLRALRDDRNSGKKDEESFDMLNNEERDDQ